MTVFNAKSGSAIDRFQAHIDRQSEKVNKISDIKSRFFDELLSDLHKWKAEDKVIDRDYYKKFVIRHLIICKIEARALDDLSEIFRRQAELADMQLDPFSKKEVIENFKRLELLYKKWLTKTGDTIFDMSYMCEDLKIGFSKSDIQTMFSVSEIDYRAASDYIDKSLISVPFICSIGDEALIDAVQLSFRLKLKKAPEVRQMMNDKIDELFPNLTRYRMMTGQLVSEKKLYGKKKPSLKRIK